MPPPFVIILFAQSTRPLNTLRRTQGCSTRKEGGGGAGGGTQKFVYQKWPDQIVPMVNFLFSHNGHFGFGGGGVQGGSSYGHQPL